MILNSFKDKKKRKILFKYFIIINLFIYLYILKLLHNNSDKKINKLNNGMYNSAKKAIDFLNKSSNGILINKIPLIFNNSPKMSIVVPAFNVQNRIKQTIRSIQNQNVMDLDIIIVNDYSSDNTSYIIQELKNEDKRIKIINNKRNMGSLYTRCIGSLSAKAKYIFPLDGDDMILDKDVINNIYDLMEFYNVDITVFKAIMVYDINDIFTLNNLNAIRGFINSNVTYRQPELSNIASIVLWGQCIKTNLYKKSIYLYGKNKYSIYMNYYEDAIINHIIYQISESCKLIPDYVILYIVRAGSVSHLTREININYSIMKYIETMLEFSRNNDIIKESVSSKIIYFLKNNNFYKFMNNTKFNYTFNLLLRKIFSSKYLSNKNKLNIKQNISKVLLNNYSNYLNSYK